MPLCFPLLDKVSLITPVLCHFRCELSEDKLRGKTKKWVLHVGNCTLVSVTRHLFIDIISADSQHKQNMFPKRCYVPAM